MGETLKRSGTRNYSYNALRGLFAIGILFSHMTYISTSNSDFWRFFYTYFMRYGSVCTTFFLHNGWVSGMLSVEGYDNRKVRPKEIQKALSFGPVCVSIGAAY